MFLLLMSTFLWPETIGNIFIISIPNTNNFSVRNTHGNDVRFVLFGLSFVAFVPLSANQAQIISEFN